MTIDKGYTRLNTLVELNAALGRLSPPVLPLTLANVAIPGAISAMLDGVIAADNNVLYSGMTLADVTGLYADPLRRLVQTQPPNFKYDPHGDKHFPGGPTGTKFTADKGTVNPLLQNIIASVIGRIRRNANGQQVTYYYTAKSGIPQCGKMGLVIQVSYTPTTDTVEFHGYPDETVVVDSLSRSKGGAAI